MKNFLRVALLLVSHQSYNCLAFSVLQIEKSTRCRKVLRKSLKVRLGTVNKIPQTRLRCPSFSSKPTEDDEVESKSVNGKESIADDTDDADWISTFLSKVNVFIKQYFQLIKVPLASFIAGCLLTVTIIFLPLINNHDPLEKPVTLFETILSDLELRYVDEVNTKKLFQTGVSAMLRSLDPYTEFFEKNDDIQESVSGKYGGVGLVITGATKETLEENNELQQQEDQDEKKILAIKRSVDRGIRVVNAFEGYAFDYGMRVGDQLVAIDSTVLKDNQSVDSVRDMLRGEPGLPVTIKYKRDGVAGVQEAVVPRKIVKIRDVSCVSLLDDIGYVQLSGFSQDAGAETRKAIFTLQDAVLQKNGGELQGLILDLRNNPGGLLNSAVDVAAMFVPKDSDIVSARGRGFPGVLYRSRSTPVVPKSTKLVVLVNSNTASAAEIVSGAIQDLDSGVIQGSGRTYGKGLVQNVEELPYNSALKFTVAKYYTPSGRCIQSTNYKEGGGLKLSDASYKAEQVKSQTTFYTQSGREVKDGGGIVPDYIVKTPEASALEVTLLRSSVFSDFASEWSTKNTLSGNLQISDDLYQQFISFCTKKQKSKEIQLDSLYSSSLDQLHQVLKQSGYKQTDRDLDSLQSSILKDLENDFIKYKKDIKEDIAQNILSRYLPESMLIERGTKEDIQVKEAVKLIKSKGQFEKLLAKDSKISSKTDLPSVNTARNEARESGVKLNLKW